MLSSKKLESNFFEILSRFFEKYLNQAIKIYMEGIMNDLISDKYLLNSPQILFSADQKSYCYYIFGDKSIDKQRQYKKYIADEKIIIRDGKIFAENFSQSLNVNNPHRSFTNNLSILCWKSRTCLDRWTCSSRISSSRKCSKYKDN
jgi:hypothetical protein